MDKINLNYLLVFIQAGGLSLILFVVSKIFKKIKLYEIKLDALVYAIKTESNNGFGEAYDNKLRELMSEQKFLRLKL